MIQYSGGNIIDTVIDTSLLTGSAATATEQRLISSINSIKDNLVAAGWTAVHKPAGINAVFTGTGTAGQIVTLDNVVYTYRASFSANTTLSAAITDTTSTAITVTSGANIVTGGIITVDSESLYVSAGGGTANLTVIRGYASTTAATHSNGANVTIGCEVANGANLTVAATNLRDAIIANVSTVGTAFSTGTPAHPTLTATNPASGWVNIYTKVVNGKTIGKFTATETLTNMSLSGYSAGTVSYYGGWWLYSAKTPQGLQGKIAVMDGNTAATTGTYGGLVSSAFSADGAVSPTATSSGLTISITTGGVYTTSGSNQGTAVTSLKVGQEILVNSTPPQVFTVDSVTGTTTGTVTPTPPTAITTVAYSVNGVASTFSFNIIDGSLSAGYPNKIWADKYQCIMYQIGAITNSWFYTVPWISSNDTPYKITNIAASPATGTRFTTELSHGLSTGDSVYICDVKIDNVYRNFCSNATFTVVVIDTYNFDITSLTYPGGTYTNSTDNWAVMTPISPTTKTKLVRVIHASSLTNTNISRIIRNPYSTSASLREQEINIFNTTSFTAGTTTSGGNYPSLVLYTPSPYGAAIYTTINGSYTFTEPWFAMGTAANPTTWYQIGQLWDCFVAQRSASQDAKLIFDGKTWQNFSAGTSRTGSCWFVIA